MKVGEVMTEDVMACKTDDKLYECAGIMKELNVGFMPIVDQSENLVGVITDRDIAIRAVAKGVDLTNSKIGDFMTPNPITIEADYSVEDAADIMADSQIRRLPVVQNGKLVGVITLGDLAVEIGEADLVAETVEKISEPTR
ncbi:MAG TPA: CBS domain-containing protein [Armatimonadota bacterium]|jgi:CBS domain-containing protein